jgi:ATP-dependent protease Clp ATPase subunit
MGRLYEQVRRYEDVFEAEHQIHLKFDPEAVDEILRQALARHTSAYAVCQELSKDLEHALKLVRDRTAQDEFLLDREAILDLNAYLNRVIREYYQKTLFRE